MLPSLDTIALKRRALGLTQSQLANLAGVSQSYIAKLEARKIEPSYARVKAILEALERLEQRREIKVKAIMTTDLVSVRKGDLVKKAVSLMSEHGYSQLPVLNGDRSIGSITERTIIDRMDDADDEDSVAIKTVSEIMEDPFPQVGDEAPVSIIANLLRVYPAVLIHSKGMISGIVTKADLLKILT